MLFETLSCGPIEAIVEKYMVDTSLATVSRNNANNTPDLNRKDTQGYEPVNNCNPEYGI